MRKLFSLFIFFCMTSQALFGENGSDAFVIHSGEAEYNREELILKGNVNLEHSMGIVSAKHLVLTPLKDKKNKLNYLTMEEDVTIDFKNGGQLSCQNATIDYQKLSGIFLGNAQHPEVVYREKKNVGDSMLLKSKSLQVELIRSEKDKILLKQIKADQNVKAYYQNDYMIFCDYATYMPIQNSSSGIVCLGVRDAGSNPCLLINQNQDRIQAEEVVIDTQKKQWSCTKPKGTITLKREENNKQELIFSSNQMVGDEITQKISLQNDVKASLGTIGELFTEHFVEIYHTKKNGKKTLAKLVSPAETHITYMDSNKKLEHQLFCYGPLTIDHDLLQIFLQSPLNNQNQIEEGKQVYFEDLLGRIQADEIHILYQWIERKLAPSKILMKGHVKIFNRFDGHVQESGSVLQYALADLVEYDPLNKEMLLKSQGGKRVLLFDKVNNIQMSAPALKIIRDENHPKGSIKGLGDVRFTFIEKEFEQLRQSFKFSDKSKK